MVEQYSRFPLVQIMRLMLVPAMDWTMTITTTMTITMTMTTTMEDWMATLILMMIAINYNWLSPLLIKRISHLAGGCQELDATLSNTPETLSSSYTPQAHARIAFARRLKLETSPTGSLGRILIASTLCFRFYSWNFWKTWKCNGTWYTWCWSTFDNSDLLVCPSNLVLEIHWIFNIGHWYMFPRGAF